MPKAPKPRWTSIALWGSILIGASIGWLVKRRIVLIGLVGASLLVSIFGFLKLRLDFSSEVFFSGDNTIRQKFSNFSSQWGNDDNIIPVIIKCNSGTWLSPFQLKVLAAIADSLRSLPFVTHIENFAHATLTEVTWPSTIVSSSPLKQIPDDTTTAAYKKWYAKMVSHPLYIPHMLSKDAKRSVIHIHTDKSSDNFFDTAPYVKEIHSLLTRVIKDSSIQFDLAGIPTIRKYCLDLIIKNQAIFTPIVLVTMVLCLWLLFGNVWAAMICAVTALFSTVLVMGMIGLAGEPIGILNQIFLTLFPLIAVADAIHITNRHREEVLHSGVTHSVVDRSSLAQRVFSHTGFACFMTSLTTSVGFATVGITELPVLQRFGFFAAVGFFVLFHAVVLMSSLLLSYVQSELIKKESHSDWFTPVLQGCVNISTRRPKAVISLSVIILILALIGGSFVKIDNFFTALIYKNHPSSIANKTLDSEMGGSLNIQIHCDGKAGTFSKVQSLKVIDDLERFTLAQENVKSTISIASIIGSLPKLIRGKKRIPTDTTRLNRIFKHLLKAEKINSLIAEDFHAVRIIVGVDDEGGKQFVSLASRIQEKADELTEETDMIIEVTGTAVLAYEGIINLTSHLRIGLLVAIIVITILMGMLFKDSWLAIVALFPNILPLILGYGVIGISGILLDPFSAVILAIGLGLAVDDTIHLISRIKEYMENGEDHTSAIALAVKSSGKAIIITSVILIFGFGLYMFSSFPLLRTLGLIGTVIVITALIADLLILPALLTAAQLPRVNIQKQYVANVDYYFSKINE